MKDKDFETRFPWTLAFMTCSISYFGFIRMMKLFNVVLPRMFLWIGLASLLLACISAMVSLLQRRKNVHRSIKFTNVEPPEIMRRKNEKATT